MKKVIVGLSGGVDSAVSAYVLLQQGYLVEGVFMRNWDSSLNHDILGNPNNPNDVCPQEQDYLDALNVANQLKIPLHRIDFVEEYWQQVFSYFIQEYQAYRTPNPDVLCNKEIKFKAFLEKAEALGCDYIAMGHYAQVEHSPRIRLLRGADETKDQSYFLHQLSESQLAKSLFPIGHMKKQEVRAIASQLQLSVARKKDSTGVCFIGERDFKLFLQNYIPAQPGLMKDLDGHILGQHDGVMYYTIGQRHGLGIGGPGDAWFVIGKHPKDRVLLVGQGTNHPYLMSNRAIITNVNWLGNPLENEIHCSAKFRYRQKDVDVVVKRRDQQSVEVQYPSQVKAVTPGQAAVFYDGDWVLGGGTIDQVFMDDVKRDY